MLSQQLDVIYMDFITAIYIAFSVLLIVVFIGLARSNGHVFKESLLEVLAYFTVLLIAIVGVTILASAIYGIYWIMRFMVVCSWQTHTTLCELYL